MRLAHLRRVLPRTLRRRRRRRRRKPRCIERWRRRKPTRALRSVELWRRPASLWRDWVILLGPLLLLLVLFLLLLLLILLPLLRLLWRDTEPSSSDNARHRRSAVTWGRAERAFFCARRRRPSPRPPRSADQRLLVAEADPKLARRWRSLVLPRRPPPPPPLRNLLR